ncbi:LysR family transcriptional regulator [Shewanella waksmanii]|uniref:LysR family transcriptional regulator n=1 Tax=Shewanella waksmanii TaxID=213783 RepID=UPI003736BE67
MFTIEQLSAFVETVETGSFSAAARKLGKVQSAISQHIMTLEIDTNQQLFDRSGRYPQLTKAGKRLLPQAKAVIAQHRRLSQQLKSLDESEPQTLTLALDEGVPYGELAQHLSAFSTAWPNIELEFLNASSHDIIQLIQHRRADIGLVVSEITYPDLVEFETIGSIEFDLMVSTNHPLAKTELTHLDMLKLHRQVVIGARDRSPSLYNLQHSPDVWFADNYYMIAELIKGGFGWGIVPKHIMQDALMAKQVCSLPANFQQLDWLANIDIIQHLGTGNAASQELRRQLRLMMQSSRG